MTLFRQYVDFGTLGMQRVVDVRGRNEHWEETFFDGMGRTIQVHSLKEGDTEIRLTTAYDNLGQVEKEWVPYEGEHGEDGGYGHFGYVPPADDLPFTAYDYDALERPLVVTHPDDTQTVHHYDVYQGKFYDDVMDANRHRMNYMYDAFGRLVQVDEIEGDCGYWGFPCDPDDPNYWTTYATTYYGYDELDNLEVVTDHEGNLTTMEYDTLGRKEWMDDPDMGYWTYTYEAVGNLETQTDAKDQIITFEYDKLNRLTRKEYLTGDDVHFEYDNARGDAGTALSWGRLRASYVGDEAANGRLHEYDGRGRVVRDTTQIDGSSYETSYTYDALDRVVTMTYPDGEEVTTTYNDQGLAKTLAGTSPYVSDATYNALGQIQEQHLGNGAITTWKYYGDGDPWGTEPNFRLWQVLTMDSQEQELLRLEYAYDAVGNVSFLVDYYNSSGGIEDLAFTYDSLDRLTDASEAYDAHYEYSPIGNLEEKTEDGRSYILEYNDPNHVHAVSAVNGVEQSYDANGNMTQRVVDGVLYVQEWDDENRLVSVTANGQTTSFTYDANGALVKRLVDGQTTHFVGSHHEKNVTTGGERTYYYFSGVFEAEQGS